MTSPELREQTASEALTLEEEYEMCEKWRVDDDSTSLHRFTNLTRMIHPNISSELTFIILANALPSLPLKITDGLPELVSEISQSVIQNTCPMIGDINLFFKPGEAEGDSPHDGDEVDHTNSTTRSEEVEVEIMIASQLH